MFNNLKHLSIKWSVSRGRETEGYNICTLTDMSPTGKRYRTIGGGYDMVGTVFADWLVDNYQPELLTLKERAYYVYDGKTLATPARPDSFYGLYDNSESNKTEKMSIDGGCGLDSVLRIARAIGLDVERAYIKTGKHRGETIGYYVQKADFNVL